MNSMTTTPRALALVTGASGGIGRAIAERFAQDGYDLVITARDADALRRIADDWSVRHRVTVTPIATDLSRPGAADALADTLAQRGLVPDHLVNNAGVGLYGLFADTRLDDELAMMTLNMTAATVLTKRLLPGIVARRGRILNVASTASFQPGPYMSVYYATKAYLLSFSEALAEELAGTGVTVTALCPGPTASGFQDKAAMHDSALVKDRRLPAADEVGAAGYDAMRAGRRVYVHGASNRALVQTLRVTPRRMVTALVRRMSVPV